MAHIREQIRDAAVTALVGQTAAGSHCEAARPAENASDRLPALFVMTLEETSNRGGDCQPLQRFPQLVIVGMFKSEREVLDHNADALALQVERAMAADETLGGTVLDMILTGTEIRFGGEFKVGSVELTYQVEAAPVALADM